VAKKPKADPLRIGIDARLAYRRGVGTYTANLILALAKVDPSNEYFLFNAPLVLKKKVRRASFHWVEVPFSNAAYYEQVLLPRAAKEHKLDLLHYVDNSASLISDVPIILTLHDVMYRRPLSAVRARPTFRQRLVHAYKQWAIPRSAYMAQKVITVSEYSKAQIVRTIGIPSGKVTVTLEGVDRHSFRKGPAKRQGLFKVLVHGAADDRKNLSNILKAVQVLVKQKKSFQVEIIGMDREELAWTPYQREALELGLEPYVKWVGNIPSGQLAKVYHECDLFLYPSKMEGFGLPVLEAFACGVPVITSTTTSLPEVADRAAVLVDPEDPVAIARAVRDMMERPQLRRDYAKKGLKRAGQFTWEKMAKETLAVYGSMGGRI
jgi:glycosyltransferase involved in cell wall biosynthesis